MNTINSRMILSPTKYKSIKRQLSINHRKGSVTQEDILKELKNSKMIMSSKTINKQVYKVPSLTKSGIKSSFFRGAVQPLRERSVEVAEMTLVKRRLPIQANSFRRGSSCLTPFTIKRPSRYSSSSSSSSSKM